jgi:hypothetical protein
MHIPLTSLHPHPLNSNVLPGEKLDKLARHIESTGRYPPLIVRPLGDGYQLLDGHHRARVLQRLGHITARCDVWEVDDEQALLLLATLNRLSGADDPHRRATLVAELAEQVGKAVHELDDWLPDRAADLDRLIKLQEPPPAPAPPVDLADMPRAVTFFLTGDQRRRLDAALKQIGGDRAAALMQLLPSQPAE